MCDFIMTPLAAIGNAIGNAIGATVSGATAGAGTLQTLGLITSIGGSIASGIAGSREAKAQAAAIEEQKTAEARMTAVEDQRTRAQYRSAMRRQTAELAARGIAGDSVTAVLLGQTAGAEMSYASQGVRQGGAAKQTELTATQKALRARGTQSLLGGYTSAASSLLTAAPQLWPELHRG